MYSVFVYILYISSLYGYGLREFIMRSLGFDEENRTMIKASIKLSIIVYSTNVLVPQSMLLWALVWIVISGYAFGTPILSYKLKIFFLYGITNNYTQATDMNKKFTLARRIKSYLSMYYVCINL